MSDWNSSKQQIKSLVNLKNKKLLDIGCEMAGYYLVFQRYCKWTRYRTFHRANKISREKYKNNK